MEKKERKKDEASKQQKEDTSKALMNKKRRKQMEDAINSMTVFSKASRSSATSHKQRAVVGQGTIGKIDGSYRRLLKRAKAREKCFAGFKEVRSNSFISCGVCVPC